MLIGKLLANILFNEKVHRAGHNERYVIPQSGAFYSYKVK